MTSRDPSVESSEPPPSAAARGHLRPGSRGAGVAWTWIIGKLRSVGPWTAALGSAAAVALLAAYFCVAARDQALAEATLLAEQVARHGVPAMVRDDPRGAGELLQALELTPSVVGARLLRAGGGELAVYRRAAAGEASLPEAAFSPAHRFSWRALDLTVPMRHDGRIAGVLQLRVSLEALQRQIVGIVLATSLALALVLTWALLARRVPTSGGGQGQAPAAQLGSPGLPGDAPATAAQDADEAASAPGADDRVLPVPPRVRWAEDPPPPVERRAFVGRVLVVEDHPLNQQTAVAALSALRVDPTLAPNGRRALELLSEKSFDLVLMDCRMPEMDGFEATAAIRAAEFGASASRRLPVIALTADADEGDRARWQAAGMDDQLAKPFTATQLDAVLARWLPRRPAAAAGAGPATPSVNVARAPGPTAIDARALTMVGAIDPGGERGLLRDTVQAYVSGTAARLGELTSALASRDVVAVAAAARALRSASEAIGADGLARLLRELEERVPDGDLVAACVLADRAIGEFARIVTELRQLVERLAAR